MATAEMTTAPTQSARDRIRSKTLASRQPLRKEVEFFGETIEIMQPILGDIVDISNEEDRQAAIVEILVKYAVVPGTTEKVYETGDADNFKTMPFGADFSRVAKAFAELTDVNFLDKNVTSGTTGKST